MMPVHPPTDQYIKCVPARANTGFAATMAMIGIDGIGSHGEIHAVNTIRGGGEKRGFDPAL